MSTQGRARSDRAASSGRLRRHSLVQPVGRADAEVTLPHIADLLGHASTRMLEQHYRHRVRKSRGAHVGPMEEQFGGG